MGETVECGKCPANRTRLKVFECAIHTRCVQDKAAPGVASCKGCPDHQTFSPRAFPIRDCLYHVFPLARAGSVWRRCVSMLARRSNLFAGKRICAVMTGPGLESPDAVQSLLPGFEILPMANDPTLREARSLPVMLEMVESNDPGRAVFFGQAKGVTRPASSPCHPWSWLLHEAMLDFWPAIERQLSEFPLTGCFKKPGRYWPESRSSWHYSGSFFWARSADLFAKNWREIDQIPSGVEPYPSLHFARAEAGDLFGGKPGAFHLYDPSQMKDEIIAFAHWKAEHDHMRTRQC